MSKEIYINETTTIWGGKCGEVSFETQDGTVIIWNARSLHEDLPHLIAMCHLEMEAEQINTNEKWNALGKKIQKEYPIKSKRS